MHMISYMKSKVLPREPVSTLKSQTNINAPADCFILLTKDRSTIKCIEGLKYLSSYIEII